MRKISTQKSIRRAAALMGGTLSILCLVSVAWAQQQASPRAQGVDALQWLEAPKDARALQWAKEQTDRSRAEIERKAQKGGGHARLLASLKASAPVADVSLGGAHAMRLQKDADHPHGQLQIADSSAAGIT